MVIVRMPGGDVESIAPDELLWMRQAFDHEFKDAVMLRITGDRIYSVETVASLAAKFAAAGAAMARLTPPEGAIEMMVSAERVREVEPPSPAIHHEGAGSVLKFGPKLMLAVRESEAQAKSILAEAVKGRPPAPAALAAAALGGAIVGAAVAVAVTAPGAGGPDPEAQERPGPA
ncbi:hypothetical protein Mpop_2522 [Methylorubrum populi BJ001]|jgi:hypothetical protein|uniref:Uncharacterized protein n=4 Tax=Methylobacteriaceae TaxID=119045 RepID=A0A509EDA9_9HYPH|nr:MULTISPECIES: hypothetical protein [Methylobacteriaceae]MRI53833.1 hypothetical protein [Methylobacterium sp. DB1607]OAH33431.1 hypothetical protein AX289_00830 [Methylorubrum populi]ACB80682.1 hypothetical protein Mpop_2522 [Methylorubrum populi BJ001]MBD8909287.1 hypothetical protein [Methylorubrum zatmanii]UMY19444.1 hypothetical protein MMB17_09170 [Methylobacterium organophilum]